jgi:hypothetical protein
VSHRQPSNHRKGVGLAILLAVALTISVTTAFTTGTWHHGHQAKGLNRTAAATLADPRAKATIGARPATAKKTTHHVILVVGDSLVAQAAARLRAASNTAVRVEVAAELGSAPCDWTAGRFDAELEAVHPDVVVFAFVGNTGLSSGCLNTKRGFALSELLSSYRASLTSLANRAEAAAATVIIATPPARNPAAPPPPDTPTTSELANPGPFYGYQGVPAIRSLYAQLVAANLHWRLTDAPALAVSPDFIYKQILSCDAGDGSCDEGFVAVREGHDDAIHLDATGNGAKRYASALVASAVTIADQSSGT